MSVSRVHDGGAAGGRTATRRARATPSSAGSEPSDKGESGNADVGLAIAALVSASASEATDVDVAAAAPAVMAKGAGVPLRVPAKKLRRRTMVFTYEGDSSSEEDDAAGAAGGAGRHPAVVPEHRVAGEGADRARGDRVRRMSVMSKQASDRGMRIRVASNAPSRPRGLATLKEANRSARNLLLEMRDESDDGDERSGDGAGRGATGAASVAGGALRRGGSFTRRKTQRSKYARFVAAAGGGALKLYRDAIRALVLSDRVARSDAAQLALFRQLYGVTPVQHYLVLRDLALQPDCIDTVIGNMGGATDEELAGASRVATPINDDDLTADGEAAALVSDDDDSDGSAAARDHPLDRYRSVLAQLHEADSSSITMVGYAAWLKARQEGEVSHNDHIRTLRQLSLPSRWCDVGSLVQHTSTVQDLAKVGRRLLAGKSAELPRPSSGTAAAVASEPLTVLHRGWLYKKGKRLGRWSRRWFVLLSNMALLSCKSKDEETAPSVVIDMLRAQVDPMWEGSRSAEEDSSDYYCFAITVRCAATRGARSSRR